MDLSAGARLGPYEIISALGAGGMGQVYLARDTRLDRSVAIKVLPQTLAGDGEFRERFDREARVIAQLDHPHICALYDVGQHQRTSYLVMPFLDGETLAQRLQRGALPVDHAIEYAIQISDALARAHAAGIVHRDLKPANVMLTKAGAKLLDFGLAKAATPLEASPPSVSAVTTPVQLTAQGTIMGTFQYMAPEQIEGREATARSDIWAFGAVLYEMLSGAPPFVGKSPASLLANILNTEPPPLDLRGGEVRGALGDLIRRCLAKDPDVRWQSMIDATHQLRWIANAGAPAAATPARAPWRRYLAYAAVALFATVATAGVMLFRSSTPPAIVSAPLKLTFVPREGLALTPFASSGVPHFAVSPDGERMAFVASTVGQPPTLWVQRLDSRAAQQIPGSRDASAPFWFPDGQSIGFFGEGRLRTIPLAGSRPSVLAAIGDTAGGASNGETILVGQNSGPIMRISVAGGRVTAATTLRPEGGGHRWPQFLPDGRRFIYTEARGSVMVATLDSTASTEVMPGRTTAVYDPSGWLLTTGSAGRLVARPFDPDAPGSAGSERDVLDEVQYAVGAGVPPVSIARSGVLTYWDGTTVRRDHTWFDREAGRVSGVPITADADGFAIAPDGRLAVARRTESKDSPSIWLMNAAGAASRFSYTPDGANRPTWSHDGKHLMFVSRNRGVLSLFRRAVSGLEKEQLVGTIPYPRPDSSLAFGDVSVTDWSRDGRTVLLSGSQLTTAWDIFAVDIATNRHLPLRQTAAYEIQGRWSPDNRFFAYSSNESGRWEVIVEPFPPTGTQWQVSTDGGSQPVWRRDGSELFFVAADGKMMAAAVRLEPTFVASPPVALFQTPMRPPYPPYPFDYDVTADGKRFLIEGVRPNTSPTISVVVNWSVRQ